MVVDEIMSAWRGAEGKYSADGLPHVTKIARKPEGVGAEMKALADGESNIMLRLDIMRERTDRAKNLLLMLDLKVQRSRAAAFEPLFRLRKGHSRRLRLLVSEDVLGVAQAWPALYGVCEDSKSRISQALLGILRRSIWTRPSATSRGLATVEIKCCTRRKGARAHLRSGVVRSEGQVYNKYLRVYDCCRTKP